MTRSTAACSARILFRRAGGTSGSGHGASGGHRAGSVRARVSASRLAVSKPGYRCRVSCVKYLPRWSLTYIATPTWRGQSWPGSNGLSSQYKPSECAGISQARSSARRPSVRVT
jgi:hypothetical protein